MLTLFQNLFAPPRDMILVVLAFWIGLSLAEKRAEKFGVSAKDLNNLTFYALIGFIAGGRLLYAIENFPAFSQNPLSIFSLNLELFDLWGGLAVAGLAAFVYGQRNNMSLWSSLDALTLFFATLALGLGLSHLASGKAFGMETSLPWGIELWGATRHPSQIYELIASTLTLGLLWFRKGSSASGIFFLTFSALTSGWQLLFQGFRGDSTLVYNGFRLEQLIAWLVLFVSLILLEIRRSKLLHEADTYG